MTSRLPLNKGATPDDWTHFDLILGLGEDLLPVVSNPNAEVSAQSKVKDIGKTPSKYNPSGKVVGIPNWTAKKSKSKEIDQWATEPDYGICMQTRTIRGLDVDVPDHDKAKVITDFIAAELGRILPTRFRNNSGKVLQAFTLPGDMPKRKLIVDGGMIEFLATGQQFIAIGTHPSGARYEWDGGLPTEFPSIPLDTFEDLWSALAARFATEDSTVGTISMRQRGEHIELPDPVLNYLTEKKLILATDRDGALLIKCPWDSEHTTGEAGDGSTCWFPAGTNGYGRGNFKCLHGHCEGRSNAEFFEAVGYEEDVIDDFEPLPALANESKPMPNFKRDGKGKIEASISNVTMAVRRPDLTGMDVRHDEFKDEIVFSTNDTDWQQFLDADYSRLRIILEKAGFKPVGRELIRDVVHMVSDDNRFDTAIAWLNTLKWDGAPRVGLFMVNYFGSDDTDYNNSVGLYLWSAMAGRVLVPGIKADMVPILVGEQGTKKSSTVAAMVPSADFFTEVSFHESDDDLARKMRGRLVAEIGELRGLHTRELESIKAFITRTHENWVPKYREFAVQFPRRIVFVGTTNKDEFLADETGNRRWLPVKTGECDIDAVTNDRLQLWAEAREIFKRDGINYQVAEHLAKDVHAEHTITDPWAEAIHQWLDESEALTDVKPLDKGYVTVGEVASSALQIDTRNLGKREEMRIGNSLRECGLLRVRKYIEGKVKRVWIKDVPPLTTSRGIGGHDASL